MDAGETVSKGGIVIPFELYMEGEKPAGYRFERTPLMSLKAGDQIRIYTVGIEPEPMGGDRKSGIGGVWKLVTIAGFKENGGRVHLEVQEQLKMKNGGFAQQIVLTARDHSLASGPAAVAAAAEAAPATAERAPGRGWSLSDVPLWGWIAVLVVALGGMAIMLLRRKSSSTSTSERA